MKAGRWGGGQAVRGRVGVTVRGRTGRGRIIFTVRFQSERREKTFRDVLIYKRPLEELQTLLAHKHVSCCRR